MKNYQYLNYDELLNVFNHQDKSEKIEEAIFHEIIELYLKNNQLESNENIEKIEEEGLVQIDGKYYNLNITTLSITTISLIIDILFTNGMLQVGLSGLGIIKPFLERVNTKNGELCVFKNFETGYNYSMVTEKLLNSLNEKECPYKKFNCIHKDKGKCTIKEDVVKSILFDLKERKIIQ